MASEVAFTDVTVVPMDSERTVPGQTVLVTGDRISWSGPAGEAPVTGATCVDGQGKYLMPGLADMHTHPADEDDLLLCVAYGVTTIRVMWGMPRHIRWRDGTAAGELLGPDIHTAGPILDGRPPRNERSTSVVTVAEAERAVTDTRLSGHASIKVYDQLAPDTYDTLVRAAHDQGLTVVGHIPFSVGLHGALDAGQRTIEHLYGYLGASQPDPRAGGERLRDLSDLRALLLSWSRTARVDRLPDLAEATRAAGAWNCPTLIVRRRWLDDPEELLGRPEMRYLTPAARETMRRFVTSYPANADASRVVEFNGRVIAALRDAGAGLLAGTDAGAPAFVHGAAMGEELAGLVAAGLSPYEALRAATAGPAEYLGQAGERGVVAVGARADLVLLDADPLADISNTGRIAGVMARGRWYPANELRERLDALAARRAAAGPPRVPAGPSRTSAGPPRGAAGAPRVPAAGAGRVAAPARPPRGGRGDDRSVVCYRIERDGRVLGTEELTVERGSTGGARRLVTKAEIQVFGSQLTQGLEAGRYFSEVEIDPDGRDHAARFTCEGPDGTLRAELVEAGGHVRVRLTDPVTGERDDTVPAAGSPVFGWPLTGLYARLGARLIGLGVGERTEIAVVGPGLPPDRAVGTGTARARRLPDTTTGSARYAVQVEWTNARHTGVLTRAADGLPGELELTVDPPIRVVRIPRPPAA